MLHHSTGIPIKTNKTALNTIRATARKTLYRRHTLPHPTAVC